MSMRVQLQSRFDDAADSHSTSHAPIIKQKQLLNQGAAIGDSLLKEQRAPQPSIRKPTKDVYRAPGSAQRAPPSSRTWRPRQRNIQTDRPATRTLSRVARDRMAQAPARLAPNRRVQYTKGQMLTLKQFATTCPPSDTMGCQWPTELLALMDSLSSLPSPPSTPSPTSIAKRTLSPEAQVFTPTRSLIHSLDTPASPLSSPTRPSPPCTPSTPFTPVSVCTSTRRRRRAEGLETPASPPSAHQQKQRTKQIGFGKNTLGYKLYCDAVPESDRDASVHPVTPRSTAMCTKRQWDTEVRAWRRALHHWDPSTPEEWAAAEAKYPTETQALREKEAKRAAAAAAAAAQTQEAHVANPDTSPA